MRGSGRRITWRQPSSRCVFGGGELIVVDARHGCVWGGAGRVFVAGACRTLGSVVNGGGREGQRQDDYAEAAVK